MADVVRVTAEVDSAHAAIRRLESQLASAKLDVERTFIRSPIDGVVVGRNVTEGQTLASSLEARTLFNIAGDLRRMEIHARVDESDIAKIAVGQTASFTVDSFPGRDFTAQVTQIRKAPQVVQNVVTYTVVLAFGYAAACVVAARFDWPILLQPWVAVAAVAIAGGVGMFFGWYPARRAAALQPVAALRRL